MRELINRVRRAIVMSEGRLITAADLELNDFATLAPVSLLEAREAAERQAIEQALLRHRGRSRMPHANSVCRASRSTG